MRRSNGKESVVLDFRCEACDAKHQIVCEPAWNVTERQAAARQHHDVHSTDCSGFRPRWGQCRIARADS